eukprot:2975712-Alexandrium_andersonii.AAC.1
MASYVLAIVAAATAAALVTAAPPPPSSHRRGSRQHQPRSESHSSDSTVRRGFAPPLSRRRSEDPARQSLAAH